MSKTRQKQNSAKTNIPAQTDEENEEPVKLKPFMGMRPGVYLTVLYSFIILIVLFFLLIFPGLKNPGAVIIVKTEPYGAAVRVNDVYMGLAGSKIFIPNGTHIIEAVMPGFEKQGTTQVIKGRVFGSLFFPSRYNIGFSFKTSDPAAAFALYAADFAQWTFAGEPTSTWQIPMSLSEGAYRTGPYAGVKTGELNDLLKAASRFTVTRAALRDLIRAKILLDNLGSAPSAAALLGTISDVFAFLSENPESANWLLELLPVNSQTANIILESDWYKKNNQYSASSRGAQGELINKSIELEGLTFSCIALDSEFYICDTPVPLTLFEKFLNEKPQWKDQYQNYSATEITVNPLEIYRRGAVTGVTWYAAQAFCEWLTAMLPSSLTGMKVKLPNEAQWQAASAFLSNMRFPGWEWCEDPYAPLDYIAAPKQAVDLLGSPERLLLGNSSDASRGRFSLDSAETRAFLPPSLSSPLVTFRLVISE